MGVIADETDLQIFHVQQVKEYFLWYNCRCLNSCGEEFNEYGKVIGGVGSVDVGIHLLSEDEKFLSYLSPRQNYISLL